jgi:hypothetical protein
VSERNLQAHSPTRAGRVDDACDRFEAVWKAGGRPRIEDHLGAVEDDERRTLLRELLALEIKLRRRAGEEPAVAE